MLEKVSNLSTSVLPTEIQKAIQAIELEEVQEMLEKLSKYNLGVCVPHKHNEDTGNFEVLPEGVLQVENDLQVSFMRETETHSLKGVPVAWRWQNGGVKAAAKCISFCTYVEHQGREFHQKTHKKV